MQENFKSVIATLANPGTYGVFISGGGSVPFRGAEITSPTESWSDLTPNFLNQLVLRLSSEVETLKAEVSQIKKQAISVNTQIKNLYSDRLTLKEPLNIILKEDSGSFVANALDIDTYGVGDSAQEAIKDLGENIDDVYFTFKTEGVKNLGPQMLKIWNYMSGILKENKYASKDKRHN